MNDEPTATGGPAPDVPQEPLQEPSQLVGSVVAERYKLLGVIGEGGFGIVYEADQTEPVRRRVALKVIKPGMDSHAVVARFEAERQALAVMDHPGIARVLDGGETKRGLPFFVMELVRGEPITEYCDKHRLSIEDRLQLFAKVCDAVQHAHSKAVIHRDIKPSNVLVERRENSPPEPKVIDFGIAKAIGQQLTDKTLFTAQGQIVGTPEYMSPEQADLSSSDIDTRSDVYSLGVLLYELLAGRRPFNLREVAWTEIYRVVREVEAPKPSTMLTTAGQETTEIAHRRRSDPRTLSAQLRAELEWIPLKALRKDRSERFRTPSEMGDDVRRYLRGESIESGPVSRIRRMRKFRRRHHRALCTVVGIASLLAFMIGATLVGSARALATTYVALVMSDTFKEIARDATAESLAHFATEQITINDDGQLDASVLSETSNDKLVTFLRGNSESIVERRLHNRLDEYTPERAYAVGYVLAELLFQDAAIRRVVLLTSMGFSFGLFGVCGAIMSAVGIGGSPRLLQIAQAAIQWPLLGVAAPFVVMTLILAPLTTIVVLTVAGIGIAALVPLRRRSFWLVLNGSICLPGLVAGGFLWVAFSQPTGGLVGVNVVNGAFDRYLEYLRLQSAMDERMETNAR